MAKTAINKLQVSIQNILEDYCEDLTENLNDVVDKVSKEGVKALKAESREKFKGTGKYAKGWKRTVEKKRMGDTAIIHNDEYRLPHLLEHGHANRNGGRTPRQGAYSSG